MMSKVHRAVIAVVLVTAVSGCGSGSAGSAASSDGSPGGTAITVFAAASLRVVFTELGGAYERENPGASVTFSFAGSSDLVAQILAGAPADVFASADTSNMSKAVDGGVVAGQPVDFATNTLTIVVPRDNPARITSFADLGRDDVSVVICAPQVPCGSATQKVENVAGTSLSPVSEESSVTDVLNKVISGEADAGLVYATDAAAAGDKVTAIAFPESGSAVNTCRIAALEGSTQPDTAGRFVEMVTGPVGRSTMAAAGFGAA
jgi:molybdate transport system substrate-binding protein